MMKGIQIDKTYRFCRELNTTSNEKRIRSFDDVLFRY